MTDQVLVRLDDVLDTYPTAMFNIDVKTDDAVSPVIEILRAHDRMDRVCVASFGTRRIRRLRRTLGSGWCTAHARNEIAVIRLLAWLRLPLPRWGDVIQAPETQRGVTVVDRRLVEACHARGIAVHVWTVDDPDRMERLGDLGVDALITDRPDLAR